MKLSKAIGNRIRQSRLKAGLNQRQLASKISITAATLSSIELGDSLPSIKSAVDIAHALAISLDWMFTGAAMDTKNETQEFSQEEIEMIIAYREATKPRRQIALEILKNAAQDSSIKSNSDDTGEN